MDAFWSIIASIGLSGLVVSLFNIRKAIFLGMIISILVICIIFIVSLSHQTGTGWELLSSIVIKLGNMVALLILVLFYALFCLWKNHEYISDGSMPASWYLFSYFVVVVTAMNICMIVAYVQTKDETYNALTMLLNTLLLGFIMIETIICSYFRTDGFSL